MVGWGMLWVVVGVVWIRGLGDWVGARGMGFSMCVLEGGLCVGGRVD